MFVINSWNSLKDRQKKIVPEEAQCSETDLCMLWTVVRFLVFIDVVDFVLNLRSEMGTWTNSEFKNYNKGPPYCLIIIIKPPYSWRTWPATPPRPRILQDWNTLSNWLSGITDSVSESGSQKHPSSQFTRYFEYKIDHIKKSTNNTTVQSIQKSVPEYCASSGTKKNCPFFKIF